MAYDVDDLRGAVRALLQNQGPDLVPDLIIDQHLLMGKRRLDRDYPRLRSKRISPGVGFYYNLTSLVTDWQPHFSTITKIVNPAPDVNTKEEYEQTHTGSWRVLEMEDVWYLRYEEAIPAGRQMLIYYTTPWELERLDGATVTTVADKCVNALEWICASIVCQSLAAKYAGATDKRLPADIVNWADKEGKFRRVAREFETLYLRELGLSSDKPKPVAVTKAIRNGFQDGYSFLTHRRFRS